VPNPCFGIHPKNMAAADFCFFKCAGDGKEVRIYDGRPDSVQSTFGSLNVVNGGSRHPEVVGSVAHKPSGVGEIHYLRDSDDERPDSDEDPDDDLDI
jgi:hypothetical protein